jgi:glycerol-3-phosphate dehydrogenase (NAD(P)+)
MNKKNNKLTVAVLGAGNMGTAIAQLVAQNGHAVRLWGYEGDPEPLAQIKKFGENKKYLPGIKLSKNLIAEPDLVAALDGVSVVFFVVPSRAMEATVKRVAQSLPCGVVCVDCSKGIDEKSLRLIPDVIDMTLPGCLRKEVASISGPAIASDMVRGGFTAMSLASKSARAIERVKRALESEHLKLFATDDAVGVEIAGSFKNVYAIVLGVCDGLRLPLNTKAALLVLALREIGELVNKMGGRAETVYGLAGLGDLVGTGLCISSRNRRFGEYLATGLGVKSAAKKVGQVVEGVEAAKILLVLGKKYGLKMPFAELAARLVKDGKPKQEMEKFLRVFTI